MKAPSSGPIPIKLVANVVPIHMNRVKSRNRSLFLVLAASLKANGMNPLAPMNISSMSPTTFIMSVGTEWTSRGWPPRRGVISMTIMTAMS